MNRQLTTFILSSASLLLSANVLAAPPKFAIKDSSPETLITADSAKSIWLAALPQKDIKQFPAKKYGYISEVNGGFDDKKNCVVVARAMVVPLGTKLIPGSATTFIYAPQKTSVTFASAAHDSAEQCSAMAKAKLKEAVESVVSSLSN
jgi:hypothetical protein